MEEILRLSGEGRKKALFCVEVGFFKHRYTRALEALLLLTA